jgi:4-hydroxy-4-methyl-2-oxoglutarate aldolase
MGCVEQSKERQIEMQISDDLVKQFCGIPTGNLSDAMGRKGNMHSSIKPVYPSAKLAGRAFTVACQPADNLTIHKAITMAPAGSALVIYAGGYTETAVFGDIMALACQVRGIAGVVIDGSCRDTEEIEEMNYPVFAKGINPGGPVKETLGATDVPIQCGGIVVTPGDIIVGDRDGVVVVPAGRAAEVLEKAKAIVEKEIKVRELLKQGKTTMEIFGLDTLLKNKGL